MSTQENNQYSPTSGNQHISNRGIKLIKDFESLRLKAYRCPAGVWTIGYGHTAGVRPHDTIDELEAERLLVNDLIPIEELVIRECDGINQNQLDALVSFVFNVGISAFLRSTLLRCVKANPANPNIRNEFARWNKAKGVLLAGLIRRRRAEANLYFA